MTTPSDPSWLDAWQPHEPDRSAAQLRGLLAWLGPTPRRVLDLGCGAGRTLLALVRAGHTVTGVDRDPRALEACAGAMPSGPGRAKLLALDFVAGWPDPGKPFDMVCCLGNTFMSLADVDVAVGVLRRAAGSLAAGGVVMLDDCPDEFWPEVTEGNWQAGLAEDGAVQMVWRPDDAVFAIRSGDDVDTDVWTLKPSDTPLRMWTAGALRLAARCAGLSAPERDADHGLLRMWGPREDPAVRDLDLP